MDSTLDREIEKNYQERYKKDDDIDMLENILTSINPIIDELEVIVEDVDNCISHIFQSTHIKESLHNLYIVRKELDEQINFWKSWKSEDD